MSASPQSASSSQSEQCVAFYRCLYICRSFNMKLFVFCLLPALALGQCLTENDTRFNPGRNDRQEIAHGEQAFSVALLKKLSSQNVATNVFFSPYSTYQALILAYFGAANQTESSIKSVLQISDMQDKLATMQAYRLEKFLRNFNVSDSYTFKSSNRVYLSQDKALRPCMNEMFEGEVEPIDFKTDVQAAQNAINTWVEQETNGMIRDLIQGLDPASTMVLVNAAYFKGLWQSQFRSENTHKEVFHINHSKQALVEMMKQKGTFNYMTSERLGAHVLELPYKGEDISMFILLPPFIKNNDVDTVISRLDVESLREIVDQDMMTPQPVEVELPKFTIDSKTDITNVLEQLGVGDAFKSTADYSGFTGSKDINFNAAVHQARIEVTEEGTEAAAATAFFLFRSARPLTPAKFVCNHPFLFFLYDRMSQNILFMGVYRSPRY